MWNPFTDRNPVLDKALYAANNIMGDITGRNAAKEAFKSNLALQEQAQGYNSAEAAKARDWDKMMSDTAVQRQVNDIQSAGLNPWLAVQNGTPGASVGSGASASSSAASVSQRNNQLPGLFKSMISSGMSAINGNLSLAGRVISAAAIVLAAL